jgi:GAF domain-containing protein
VDAFVTLADSLVGDYDVVDLVQGLVESSVDLFDVAAAGLVLSNGTGDLEVLASSNEQSQMVEALQLSQGQGPCVECYRTGQVVSVADIAAGVPWPAFQEAAAVAGFRSVHAVPMRLRDESIGALNLFGDRPGGLTAADAKAAQALADVATIAILQERMIRHQSSVAEQLHGALDSRILIEQAKGVLSQQGNLDMEAAFLLLRRHARNSNQRLRDVAASVVDGTLDLVTGRPARRRQQDPAAAPQRERHE